MEERARVAEQPVGDDLVAEQRAVAARVPHPIGDDDVGQPDHHPPLARELAGGRGDQLLARPRRRHLDRAPAVLAEDEREREVMAPRRGEEPVGGAADRVDRAVAGGDPAEPGLEVADRGLVAPVEPLFVVAPGVPGERDPPAGVADVGIGEGRHERGQRSRLPDRVGVAEGDDLAPRPLDRGVLGRDLAGPGQVEDHVGAGGAGQLDGPVGGTVGGDDQLELLARVLLGERVGDLGGDHLLLVEGGDDQRDGRELGGHRRRGAAAAQALERREAERIGDVGMDEARDRAPEDLPGESHHDGPIIGCRRRRGLPGGARRARACVPRSHPSRKRRRLRPSPRPRAGRARRDRRSAR